MLMEFARGGRRDSPSDSLVEFLECLGHGKVCAKKEGRA